MFSIYKVLVPLVINCGSVSIARIRSSLVVVLEQHSVLGTVVRLNLLSDRLEQYVQPLADNIYSFDHTQDVGWVSCEVLSV